MMQIVFGIFYVLAGILLAIPYCFLAGWIFMNFLLVAVVAPAFLFIWFMLAVFANIFDRAYRKSIRFNWRAIFKKSDRQMYPYSLTLFWMWTFYILLPIILHWSAVVLKNIGYGTVSSLIDMHRYASLYYVFIAIIMLFGIIGIVIVVCEVVKNMWKRSMLR